MWTTVDQKNVKHTRGLGSVSKVEAGRLLTSNCSRVDEEEREKTFSKLPVMTNSTDSRTAARSATGNL